MAPLTSVAVQSARRQRQPGDRVDRSRLRAKRGLPVALTALALGACASGDGGVSVEGAWARASAPGQTSGAIYFEITSDRDDALLAASVPASVAAATEIHEVAPTDPAPADGSNETSDEVGMPDDEETVVAMHALEGGLRLPADVPVALRPGGTHVMLVDLAEPLEVADEVELTLDFATATDVTVTVVVAETAP